MSRRTWIRPLATAPLLICAALCVAQRLSPAEVKEANKWLNMYSTGGGGDWCSLTIKEVQDELGLTGPQRLQVDRMTEEYRVGAVAAMQKESRRAESEKLKAEFLRRTQGFLGLKWDRYRQLNLQMLGPSAIVSADIQNRLGLTKAQVDKVRKVVSDHRPELSRSYSSIVGTNWKDPTRNLAPAQRSFDRDLAAVLTEKQRKVLKRLGGRSFTIPPSAPLWRAMREIKFF
jgi:hypothetical protein